MLNKSKSFCIFPWVHTYVTPEGNVHPCCTASLSLPIENINETGSSLKQIAMSNPRLSEIRREMLTGKMPPECQVCHTTESNGGVSFREYANKAFGHRVDHYLDNTNSDGTMNIYEPMYVDVRFSNICNLKCRLCGDVFSSAWAKERRQFEDQSIPILRRLNKTTVVDDILNHIDTVEVIYWAGGEPLLTDEHYIILEELNRRKKYDIVLRYNTNTSVLEIKNRNFVNLISNFKQVYIQSSLDHYGARGEWLRHGAPWSTIVENIKKIKALPNVIWSMNTVVNKWNVYTLDDFIRYMISEGLYLPADSLHSSLNVSTEPKSYHISTLPQSMIDQSIEKLTVLKRELEEKGYFTDHVQSVINQLRASPSTYLSEVERHGMKGAAIIDARRNENWKETFPELSSL